MSQLSRAEMVNAIIDAMQTHYEANGEEGDFDDGRRYLMEDATLTEVRQEYSTWCTK